MKLTPKTMNTQHSPAPWSIGFPGNVINHQRGNVAAVNTHPDNEQGAAERGTANVKLIAAAPELLAALLVLTLTPGILAHLEASDPQALKQARSAIDNATL